MRLWAALAAAALPLSGAAPGADAVSAKPDAVAVTIYRDGPVRTAALANLSTDDTRGLAMIVETRDIELPAGRSRLRLEGVADGIIPQSVDIDGLPAHLLERNYDYDLLSPGALIAYSIGQKVRVVRANRKTGRESEETATLVSGPDGVVLDFGGRVEALHCGGEVERLVFDHAPPALTDRPTLSVLVDAPRAGRFRLRLSYLTVRLDWSADYIARINPDGATLNLTGWITLINRGATGFADAPTQVVAGELARRPVDLPRVVAPSVAPRCWPGQTTHGGWVYGPPPLMLRQVLDTASRRMAKPAPASLAAPLMPAPRLALVSQLGDYKLYSLAEPTTVAARQAKQVMFLSQPAVKFEAVYMYQVNDYARPAPVPARIVLRLDNKASQGLGRPLPAGDVSVRRPDQGRELLVGESPLARNIPLGAPFEIAVGAASDVTVSQKTSRDMNGQEVFDVEVVNAKATPVIVEVRHPRGGASGFRITSETLPHGLRAGDPVWRLTVPGGGMRVLAYTVETAPRVRTG